MTMFESRGLSVGWLFVCVMFAVGGCSTTKPAEKEKPERKWNPDYEIESYLVEEEAEAIVKLRPSDWGEVQPFLTEIFSSAVGGGELDAWASAAEEGPFELVDAIVGLEVSTEHLSRDRPSYLIFAPRQHHPWQGCLSAGLPCVLFEAPGPRYGRLILPTRKPKALADELRSSLGDGNYRLVEMQYHVRVEFAVSNVQSDSIDEHLKVRVKDEPEDDYYGRRPPARAALLQEDVSFGAYVDLRSAIDTAMYFEAWELLDRVAEAPESERMRTALEGSAAIARLTHLHMPEQAEFEDVGLTIRPTEEGASSLHVVSTRTRFGDELEKKRTSGVELADPQVERSALTVEWNAQLQAVADAVDPRKWLASADAKQYPTTEQLGEWIWVGWWRAPSAVWDSLAERFRATVGESDLSRFVAGRVRIAATEGGEPLDLSRIRGGASILVEAESKSNDIVGALRELGSRMGALETDVVERSDGRMEVRLAANEPLSEVFPEDGPTSAVERFRVDAAEGAAGMVERVAERTADTAPITSRIVAGLAGRGPVEVIQTSQPTWSGIDVTFGGGSGASFEAPDFELRPAKAYCLDSVAQQSAKRMENALRADDLDAYLAQMFRDEGSAYRTAIKDCAGKGTAASELSNWAADYLEAWKALTLYRTGSENWGKKVLEICEERDWACGIEEGEWPWIRPGGGGASSGSGGSSESSAE